MAASRWQAHQAYRDSSLDWATDYSVQDLLGASGDNLRKSPRPLENIVLLRLIELYGRIRCCDICHFPNCATIYIEAPLHNKVVNLRVRREFSPSYTRALDGFFTDHTIEEDICQQHPILDLDSNFDTVFIPERATADRGASLHWQTRRYRRFQGQNNTSFSFDSNMHFSAPSSSLSTSASASFAIAQSGDESPMDTSSTSQ